jgi:HAMP domain-containing protein
LLQVLRSARTVVAEAQRQQLSAAEDALARWHAQTETWAAGGEGRLWHDGCEDKDLDEVLEIGAASVCQIGLKCSSAIAEGSTLQATVKLVAETFGTAASPWTQEQVETCLRRLAASVAQSGDADEARIGKIMLRQFEGFIDNVSPQYGQALSDANQAWSQFKKSQLLEDAIERGSRAASGAENGIRIEFNKILNNPKLRRGLTPGQIEAVQQVVEGTTSGNILRRVGKFSPGTGRQGSALISTLGGGFGAAGAGALTGNAMLGAAGAVAVPAVGYAAQKGSEASTRRLAELARALAGTGQSAKPQASIQSQRLAELLLQRNVPYTAQMRELIYQ